MTRDRGFAAASLAAPFILYLALAALLTFEVWPSPTDRWIGGCCDPEQSIWFLRWIPYAIGHVTDPFVTQQINAPAGVNLMWNASIPFLSLVMAPVTLTLGPIVAYNVAIMLAIAFSGWCTYLALRRYTHREASAVVGGLAYAFSPYLISHASIHLNLAAAWAPPLFLLLLDDILVRRSRSPWLLGSGLGLLAAIQLLTTEEVLATCVVGASVLVIVLGSVVVSDRSSRANLPVALRRLVMALIAAIPSFLIVAGWPLAVQFFGPQRIQGQVQEVDTFGTNLLNLIVPTRYQFFTPEAAARVSDGFSRLYHEAGAYLGLPLLLLLIALVAGRWQDRRVRVAGLVGLVMLVLSLGPTLHVGGAATGIPLPWLPFSKLPLLEHALPGRMVVYMWLAVAVLVGIAIDEALERPDGPALPRLAVLAVALVVAVPAPLKTWSTEVPPFFARWSEQGIAPDDIVLMAPFFRDGGGAAPMVWAAAAGDEVRMYEAYAYVPLPDGKPSFGPASNQLTDLMDAIQNRGVTIVARGNVRGQTAADLQAASIDTVIVGPMPYRKQMLGFFTDLFARPPIEVDGVQLWTDVQRLGVAPVPWVASGAIVERETRFELATFSLEG